MMATRPLRTTEPEIQAILRCLPRRPVGSADLKARRYVGQFFHRRRLGRRIVAEVEGNHGRYTVSIDAGLEKPLGSCTCYLGRRGGCHHVRALAQTFLEAPGSFVEWREDPAAEAKLSALLSRGSRRQLRGLVLELVERLEPLERERFLARLDLSQQADGETEQPDGDDLLAQIDRLVEGCRQGLYYDRQEVEAYREASHRGYQPALEALRLLDRYLGRAGQVHESGDHAVAVAAHERLFDLVWGDTQEWFGFAEIAGWLQADLRQASARYLASLSRISRPEEYVRRARQRVAWVYPDLLVTESTPEQQAALEADLLGEMEGAADSRGHQPYSLSLLRQLYRHQGRTQEDLELCRRWRHQYPGLLAPLMDHAESVGDWGQLEDLVREGLARAEGRSRVPWAQDPARSRLERRLSRALEQQGELEEAVAHALSAFQTQPSLEGYQQVRGLAARISQERCARAVEEIVGFLRTRVSVGEVFPMPGWASPEASLLATILLAEGRHEDAFNLALATRGATRTRLLDALGSFYLEAAHQPERAAECYRHLVQSHVEGRGRDNYAIAAAYAAVLREVHGRLGRPADFDRWYAQLMESHTRFRALREEFQKRLGPAPTTHEAAA